jgi:hypothetical protein
MRLQKKLQSMVGSMRHLGAPPCAYRMSQSRAVKDVWLCPFPALPHRHYTATDYVKLLPFHVEHSNV